MRINYNFPYYRDRLSPRQKARLAAKLEAQRPEIILQDEAASILRIRTSVSRSQDSESHSQDSEEKKFETGGLHRLD